MPASLRGSLLALLFIALSLEADNELLGKSGKTDGLRALLRSRTQNCVYRKYNVDHRFQYPYEPSIDEMFEYLQKSTTPSALLNQDDAEQQDNGLFNPLIRVDFKPELVELRESKPSLPPKKTRNTVPIYAPKQQLSHAKASTRHGSYKGVRFAPTGLVSPIADDSRGRVQETIGPRRISSFSLGKSNTLPTVTVKIITNGKLSTIERIRSPENSANRLVVRGNHFHSNVMNDGSEFRSTCESYFKFFLETFRDCNELQVYNNRINFDAFEKMNLSAITKFQYSNNHGTVSVVKMLERLPGTLEELDLSHTDMSYLLNIKESKDLTFLHSLLRFSNLRILKMTDCCISPNLNEALFKVLVQLEHLEELDLSVNDCKHLFQIIVRHGKELPWKRLLLSYSLESYAPLKKNIVAFEKLPHLEYLDIFIEKPRESFIDIILRHKKLFKTLQRVRFNYAMLEKIRDHEASFSICINQYVKKLKKKNSSIVLDVGDCIDAGSRFPAKLSHLAHLNGGFLNALDNNYKANSVGNAQNEGLNLAHVTKLVIDIDTLSEGLSIDLCEIGRRLTGLCELHLKNIKTVSQFEAIKVFLTRPLEKLQLEIPNQSAVTQASTVVENKELKHLRISGGLSETRFIYFYFALISSTRALQSLQIAIPMDSQTFIAMTHALCYLPNLYSLSITLSELPIVMHLTSNLKHPLLHLWLIFTTEEKYEQLIQFCQLIDKTFPMLDELSLTFVVQPVCLPQLRSMFNHVRKCNFYVEVKRQI